MLVGLIILAFALYITFLPLFKTIQGGLQVFKERREQRMKNAINKAQLGLTMADGGDSVEKKVSEDER